ncbi:hypothetical protein [Sphingosinicella terrae]|uniref:hypothetical protein n=1 Tax=Sphingosinicella terrae TaxID=2172047 RepID=UPI000E0D1DCA|nr:hypothetical protein [Sphingosinicella terrae]
MTAYQSWREAFASALDPRLHPIEYLDGLVLSGRAQMWYSDGAAMATEIRRYPSGALVIHGLVAAGSIEEIRDLLIPRAEAWARQAGCILALIESRSGWAKALRTSGYEPHQLTIRKEL